MLRISDNPIKLSWNQSCNLKLKWAFLYKSSLQLFIAQGSCLKSFSFVYISASDQIFIVLFSKGDHFSGLIRKKRKETEILSHKRAKIKEA